MRLVLVRLSALGDLVHTWPLVTALRAAIPDLHITWVVEEAFCPLVEGHPAVDCTMTAATRRWRKAPFAAGTRAETAVLRTKLRELEPDIALDTQGTVKSAWVTRLSGAKDRVGLARRWRREALAGLAYHRTVAGCSDNPHVVATNLAAAAAVGVDPGPVTPPDGRWLLQVGSGSPDAPAGEAGRYAVLLPGAGHPSKVMGVPVLGEIARGLAKRSLKPVVGWGPGERERSAAIVEASAGDAVLAPPTTIVELAYLLHGASLVVGGDTGPTHLAASLGSPTLGVFVATDWRRNGPMGAKTDSISFAKLATRVRSNRARALTPGVPTSQEILQRCDALLKS
jgi:lipopolysaccharide heptosyltransferase I